MMDNKTIIDFYVKRLNKAHWKVIFRTESGIQARKMRKVNMLGIWSGFLLLPFWGIGFLIWILTLIDYWVQQEEMIFVTVDQMIQQMKRDK